MRKVYCLAVLCLLASTSAVWAIPSAITYQGTLRDKSGAPVNVPKTFKFQLTNQIGSDPYSKEITVANLPVTNGLFSTQLSFELLPGRTWESITPFLKVSVDGQTLAPTEPVTATVYANVSNTVVDNAITPVKIANGYGLVPSGMIAMFDKSCPAGWELFSELNDRFPMGSVNFGAKGGNLAHKHPISNDSGGQSGGASKTISNVTMSNADTGVGTASYLEDMSVSNLLKRYGDHKHSLPTHNHGGATGDGVGTTDPANSLPPYLKMVFCKKQ